MWILKVKKEGRTIGLVWPAYGQITAGVCVIRTSGMKMEKTWWGTPIVSATAALVDVGVGRRGDGRGRRTTMFAVFLGMRMRKRKRKRRTGSTRDKACSCRF
jgi:hypothetical protein